MRAVISIDLSPTGGYLATGSGDWQARVCKSISVDPCPISTYLSPLSRLVLVTDMDATGSYSGV